MKIGKYISGVRDSSSLYNLPECCMGSHFSRLYKSIWKLITCNIKHRIRIDLSYENR